MTAVPPTADRAADHTVVRLARPRAWLGDPLPWALAALLALAFGMAHLKPLFAAAFPQLERPLYEHDSFAALLWAHVQLVALSSAAALLVGLAAGIFVTRAVGREFRGLVDTLVGTGQAVPPVAVLALAVPVLGFGQMPALVALALYGLLPIVRGTVAGIEAVPAAARQAATGLGFGVTALLWRVELPLAMPVLLAGVRTSVGINIGTAAIASTVGAKTLGAPIIIGLSGFNTAYVLQGAVLLGLLALVSDTLFERMAQGLQGWRRPG